MNLGLPELLVILLFAFLIIGPERLPQLGKTIGKAIGQFRSAQDKVNDGLKKEGLDAESIKQASQNPFLALVKVGEMADKAASLADADGSGDTAGASAAPDAPAPDAPHEGGGEAGA